MIGELFIQLFPQIPAQRGAVGLELAFEGLFHPLPIARQLLNDVVRQLADQQRDLPLDLHRQRGAVAGNMLEQHAAGDLRGLLHCHTVYSDGANSVAEMAEAARTLGYAYLGITDHSIAAAYAGGLDAAAVARQHEEIDAWNRASSDVRILKGIEADILADGRLDYGEEVLSRFDFVVGSVHSRFELDEAAMTARVLAAMDDRHLTILGHPTGRLLLSRDGYALDLHAVIARAASAGVAVEINADPQRLDLDWRYCREARDAGVVISIGTDAHSLAGLGNADFGVGVARKGWLRPADILNTRDAEGFVAYAKARK